MTDPIFQKNLQDLIKGIRANKKDAAAYISQSIQDIKIELKTTDPFLKAEAVRKLTYLQMLGYNVSWASFAIVEVMSQPRFAHKRIGYLAANQSFTENTDVVLLTTNLFKKEFTCASSNQYEIGLAINCLANIATKDLARDCMTDLLELMNHTRPYVRKKAVLAMYKLYIKFPQGLRLTFDKLKERLDDNESSVISTAVNVICELANKNPRNYLAMAPKFFRLLTTSSNNWMLIKVVKLLGSLVSEEPRLARKLLEPLATIIQNTGAKSLQYECIHTVTEALPYTKREDGTDAKNAPAVIKLCSDYLKDFIEDQDQNLKYLGLVGLVNLMRSSPRSIVEHRELVLRCLNDDDVTIRSRALELLAGIVSRKSLVDLVHHLLEHTKYSEGNYRDEIIAKVLYMCSKEKFVLVTDFAWYTSVLLDLAVMQGSKHGKEVADQLIEIALRVDTVRPYAVEAMLSMLLNDTLILGQARSTVSEVLKAAAWIIGEYTSIVTQIANDAAGDGEDEGFWIEGPTGEDIRSVWRGQNVHLLVLDALLHPRATNLPPHVQISYIQAALKVFIRACSDCTEPILAQLVGTLRARLGVFLQSLNVEVQERASTLRHLLAEFEILSMTWHAAAIEEEDKDSLVRTAKKQDVIEDLLEMPVYTASSVQAVDDLGAQACIRKKRVLAVILNESFYAVHSKAQRRVPVPEGLDLENPFSSSAMSKLMAVDIPDTVTLSSLSFTVVPLSSNLERGGPGSDVNEDSNRLSKAFSKHDDDLGSGHNSSSYSSFGGNGETRDVNSLNAEDKLFYLSATSNTADIIPLSQILADTFEDGGNGSDRKGKKSSSGGKKGSKKGGKNRSGLGGSSGGFEIDKREMLPAGAVDDSDEENDGRKKKTGKKKGNRKGAGEDLESVDITTPLRADEVFLAPKHREVPSLPSNSITSGGGGIDASTSVAKETVDKDKKKKKKKDKSAEPKSSLKREDFVNVDDLISLDWPAPSISSATAPNTNNDNYFNEGNAPSKSKKSSGSCAWQLLNSTKNVDVYYTSSFTTNPMTLAVSFRVVNGSADFATIDLTIPTLPPLLKLANSNCTSTLRIASNLRSGEESHTGSGGSSGVLMLTTSDGQPITSSAVFSCTISVVLESLMGPETFHGSGSIKIPFCVAFSPHKVDEQGFVILMNKNSTKWASSSVNLSLRNKPKTALKAICKFLQAHTVEISSNNKAASMCSKTPSGGFVCVLAKVSKDGNSLTADIKCLTGNSNKADSQVLADAMAAVLTDMTF